MSVGSALVDKEAVAEGKFEVITKKAEQFLEEVKRARWYLPGGFRTPYKQAAMWRRATLYPWRLDFGWSQARPSFAVIAEIDLNREPTYEPADTV